MSVRAADLKAGDVMCVGGQIGEFVSVTGKRKAICYRPFGCDSTRHGYPGIVYHHDPARGVRVERDQEWVKVTK